MIDAPGLRRNQKSHIVTADRSLFGGHALSRIAICAHDAPSSANQKLRSQRSSRAYSRSCRSFFPSFSSIMRYAVQSISCNALIPSSVNPPPVPVPVPPPASAANVSTVLPTCAFNRPSCTHLLLSSAASFGALVAGPGPSRRTSAAVSNLAAKMRAWKCGLDVLERTACRRRLTSRSGISSRGGPSGSLVTANSAMFSRSSCGIVSNGVRILFFAFDSFVVVLSCALY